MKKRIKPFSENIRAIREFLDLTQSELEVICSLAKGQCAHFEAGRREPALKNLVKLKQGLRVSYDKLIEGVDRE